MKTLPFGILLHDRPNPPNALRVDMAVLPMLTAMMSNGVRIDKTHLVNLHRQISTEMTELEVKVNEITKHPINMASGDQLADLLYNHLKLTQAGKEKWTKSKVRLAADSDVLKAMISKHACIPLILQYKQREKLRAAFTLSLVAKAEDDSRIHCDFNHTSTDTGRLSSSDPNLQQIPGRSKLGKEVRRGFIADPGEYLGVIDLSQIEMRTTANDAKCPALMDIFESKRDLYWTVSERVNKTTFSQEDREHGVEPVSGLSFKSYYRQSAKVIVLGTTYSITPSGLVDLFLSSEPPAIPLLTGGGTVWDYETHYEKALAICTEFIKGFFDGFPELGTRRREHHRRARRWGCVWDLTGRIRWIPQMSSTLKWIVSEGERAAGNMAGQGTAAGIMKLWMAVTYQRIEEYWGKRGIRPLLTCHDETVVSGPKNVVPDFLEENKEIVRTLIPRELFSVPIEAESSFGERYGDIK